MNPAGFPQCNMVLHPPEGMTSDECRVLEVCICQPLFDPHPVTISCWIPTKQELDEINKKGRIWIGVMGTTMPPIWVSGCNPFEPSPPG